MTTWLEVKRLLRDGYKVAITLNENLHVYAQKTDYIQETERNGTHNDWIYTDYDGNEEDMHISHIDKVIYHSPYRGFAPIGE